MKNHAVVVGGGICGLMAALLLKRSFSEVTLIEQSAEVGGLFRSIKDDLGAYYDMGSHIPNETGIAELDEMLFGSNKQQLGTWNMIEKLKSGNYFGGEWDLNSPFADSKKLDKQIYQQGCAELIQSTKLSDSPLILPFCKETLGDTFTNHIVIPILQKLYGRHTDLSTLTMGAGLFGFTRILAFDAEVADVLKQLPVFDAKLGYQTLAHFDARQARDSSSTPRYYYPKTDHGIQAWVSMLAEKVTASGVNILCESKITSLEMENKKVKKVYLANVTEPLKCDLLFWSAPPFIALQALGLPVVQNKPELRTAIVFHLNFDKPLNNQESHYLWVWDKDTDIFRLTLYPNLNPNSQFNTLSAEILCKPDEVDEYTLDLVLSDLREMKMISDNTQCISHIKQVIHNTFPVPTQSFEKNNELNYQTLENNVDNVIISGRSGGKQWRQADVLIAAYNEILDYISAG